MYFHKKKLTCIFHTKTSSTFFIKILSVFSYKKSYLHFHIKIWSVFFIQKRDLYFSYKNQICIFIKNLICIFITKISFAFSYKNQICIFHKKLDLHFHKKSILSHTHTHTHTYIYICRSEFIFKIHSFLSWKVRSKFLIKNFIKPFFIQNKIDDLGFSNSILTLDLGIDMAFFASH